MYIYVYPQTLLRFPLATPIAIHVHVWIPFIWFIVIHMYITAPVTWFLSPVSCLLFLVLHTIVQDLTWWQPFTTYMYMYIVSMSQLLILHSTHSGHRSSQGRTHEWVGLKHDTNTKPSSIFTTSFVKYIYDMHVMITA